MEPFLQDLQSVFRLDLAIAAVAGAMGMVFWRRVLPLLTLVVIGVVAWRWDIQSLLANASPVVIAVGAVVLGLATLQAVVVLLFGSQAANGAIGYLVATLVAFIIKAPFLLLFAIARRLARIRPRGQHPTPH